MEKKHGDIRKNNTNKSKGISSTETKDGAKGNKNPVKASRPSKLMGCFYCCSQTPEEVYDSANRNSPQELKCDFVPINLKSYNI
jgi:hypothetical protein